MGRVPRHQGDSEPTVRFSPLSFDSTNKPSVPPHSGEGETPYTLPALQLPDGTYIMDSKLIAKRLELDYPSPSLHLDSPILPEAYQLVANISKPLHAVWMPKVPVNLLNPPSSEYFHRTREENVGKPLSVYAKEKGGEKAWIAALPAINTLAEVVKKNGGPFVMGKTRK